MPSRIAIPSFILGLVLLILLGPAPAQAAAITAATGTPFVTAAKSKLRSAGISLLTDAGQDVAAVIKSEAWTWNYAFVPFSSTTANDTTLNPPIIDTNPDLFVAAATAEKKSRLFNRKATATGSADKRDGSINVNGTANKFAVAKSLAGIGKEVKTDGAGLLAVIVSKLTEIALDPPAESLLPGEEVLDELGGSVGPGENPEPAASFLYEIEITPPTSAFDSEPYILYQAEGALYFNPLENNLYLEVSDTHGLLTEDDFAPMYAPDGVTIIGFSASKDIAVPFSVPTSWLCSESDPTCDPFFGLSTKGGVYAAATDDDPVGVPEPSGMALVGASLVLGGLFSMRRRLRCAGPAMRMVPMVGLLAFTAAWPNAASAVEQGTAKANNTTVIKQDPAGGFDFKGVSVAGAAVFNPGALDARVSQEPVPDPFPGGLPPALPKDTGNKVASQAEGKFIEGILYNLRAWTFAKDAQDRKNGTALIQQQYDLIKPGNIGFAEVSKEVQQMVEQPPPGEAPEFYNIPIQAATPNLSNNTAQVSETAGAGANQTKVSEPDEEPYVSLWANVTSTIADKNAKDNVKPVAVGIAKNRDPYRVGWDSLRREMTVELTGLELMAATSDAGQTALAFTHSALTVVDGSFTGGEVDESIGPHNPFARRLFSFDLWIASILGGPAEIQEFDLSFDPSVMVSDSMGNTDPAVIRDALLGLLLESNFHLQSPYLLTFSFEPVAGAVPFQSTVFAENYAGAAVASIPEPSALVVLVMFSLAFSLWRANSGRTAMQGHCSRRAPK